MKGAIGSYIKAASEGVPAAREHLKGVFSADFQNPAGWTALLDTMPGGSEASLLARSGFPGTVYRIQSEVPLVVHPSLEITQSALKNA